MRRAQGIPLESCPGKINLLRRQAAGQLGTASNNVQTQIANRPREQTFQALSGLQSLYNPTLSAGENLYSTNAGIANNPKSPSILSDIGGVLGLAGSAAGAATGISDLTGGGAGAGAFHYAKGGPVKKKRPIIVGEQGEELFVPPSKGRIIPHRQTEEMLGNPYA